MKHPQVAVVSVASGVFIILPLLAASLAVEGAEVIHWPSFTAGALWTVLVGLCAVLIRQTWTREEADRG